ncbi:uncharacterized protein PRCAT00000301001 [Priceomyces carsonii]|uniref:uncharacterized protein n=1 Tax=Priceomyces carsonii TaxID=28549 RepID=UPI002EDAF949|nr:unnamed protein product [Priceomyces carsonii]
MIFHLWQLVGLLQAFFVYGSLAKRSLSAQSLVTCMDNSKITPSYFNVTFNPDDRSLRYSIDLTTEINTYCIADVNVYAYGFEIIQKTVDLCDIGWKQFCPIFPGSLQIDSISYISQSYVDEILGAAYIVPDIDAVVRLYIRDRKTGETLSCIQSSFSNGKTVSQTGAKWATAVVAGLGLLIAAVMTTFGNSNAASHISANAVSLFLYFQSVVVVSMQHVLRVPPIASAWAENLAWSMGLIRITFMQKIFRWYVQSTGGSPTTYLDGTQTKQILVQRSLGYLDNFNRFARSKVPDVVKRGVNDLTSNTNLVIMRGIKRMGYNSNIEPTAIVATGYTFFVLCGFLLVVILVLVKQSLELLIRFKKIKPARMGQFRLSFIQIVKGSLLRYLSIGFPQLIILSLWEFTENDSPALIVLAVIFLIVSLALIGYSMFRTISFGKQSIAKYNNPAAMLYGDTKILNKYGFCYTMFHADLYWFGAVLVTYNLIKSIFIGLCQGSGKTSALVIFILDLFYTAYLIYLGPYLNKPTNIVNYLMSVVNTINSFLFLFFSDLFGQPMPVSSIMGWVFFVLNAAFSLVLLILIIALITLCLLSKNPDARFAPAKDDRTSFQRMSSVKRASRNSKNPKENELLALGLAAQDHSTNWESDIYNLKDYSHSSSLKNSSRDILTPNLNDEKFVDDTEHDSSGEDSSTSNANGAKKNQSLGEKLKEKITRKISIKTKNKSTKAPEGDSNTHQINRVSDTLINEGNDALTQPPVPRDDSRTPINQHNRHESAISTGDISNFSGGPPINTKDII